MNYAILDSNVQALFAMDHWLRTGKRPKAEAYGLDASDLYYGVLCWLEAPHRRSFAALIPDCYGSAKHLDLISLLSFYLTNGGQINLTHAPEKTTEDFLRFIAPLFDLSEIRGNLVFPKQIVLRDPILYNQLKQHAPYLPCVMSETQASWPVAKTALLRQTPSKLTLNSVFEDVIVQGSAIDRQFTLERIEALRFKTRCDTVVAQTLTVYAWLVQNWENPSREAWLAFANASQSPYVYAGSTEFITKLVAKLQSFNFQDSELNGMSNTTDASSLVHHFILRDTSAVDMLIYCHREAPPALRKAFFSRVLNGSVPFLYNKLCPIFRAPKDLVEGLVLSGVAATESGAKHVLETCLIESHSLDQLVAYLKLLQPAQPAALPENLSLDI